MRCVTKTAFALVSDSTPKMHYPELRVSGRDGCLGHWPRILMCQTTFAGKGGGDQVVFPFSPTAIAPQSPFEYYDNQVHELENIRSKASTAAHVKSWDLGARKQVFALIAQAVISPETWAFNAWSRARSALFFKETPPTTKKFRRPIMRDAFLAR